MAHQGRELILKQVEPAKGPKPGTCAQHHGNCCQKSCYQLLLPILQRCRQSSNKGFEQWSRSTCTISAGW